MDETAPEEQEPGVRRPLFITHPDLLIPVGLFLTTVAAYAAVFACAFVNLDDVIYITDNPHLRSGLTLGSLKWVLLSFQPDNWFPVTRLSHLIDYTLFGDQAAAHHAVSLFIHACAALLLYGFLRSALPPERDTGSAAGEGYGAAAFVAFLFAVHPLHVESVAWVSERKDVLCAFFWFAALWAWVEWVKRPSERRYFLSLALFGLGLMSKPMIVTFPFLLLLLDIWPLRRPSSLASRLSWNPIREKIPFFFLSLCCAYLTWSAQRAVGAIHSFGSYALHMRIENALITPWIYIGKTLWPASLTVIYSWPQAFPVWEPVLGCLAILAVSVLVVLHLRNRPWLAVGWFWFLITLAPVIGLVQVGEQVRADRYMYVPMVGLGLMLAGAALHFLASRPFARRPAAVLAFAVVAAMSIVTWFQVRYWSDSETLFDHAIREDPANYSAWFYLGNTLSRVPGHEREAISAFEAALSAKPDFPDARERLARSLCMSGRDVEGLVEFGNVLNTNPHDLRANVDMGSELVKLGRVPDALPHFQDAVRVNPQSAEAQVALGTALEGLDPAAAAVHLELAAQLDPTDAGTWCGLGNALRRLPAREREAADRFRRAVAIQPNLAAAHLGLGLVLLKSPETATEGFAQLEIAQQLDPNPALRQQLDNLKSGSR